MSRGSTDRAPSQRSQDKHRKGQGNPVAAGVVGLGLMGTSIAACLLATGHSVVGVDKDAEKRRACRRRIASFLLQMRKEGLLKVDPAALTKRLLLAEHVSELHGCEVVLEAVREDIETKRTVLLEIEGAVSPQTIIGSNTSALPITQLQGGAQNPERIIGIHWGEPAHITRFMEVICGDETSPEIAERVLELARKWQKEPTLVRRDVRGFITNRIMYAMMREAFYLVGAGYATPADVDRSVRNDLGYWITFAGPFRFMDLTGIPSYAAVMHDLLPDLDRSTEMPELMRKVVASGAHGIANASGFYEYTPSQAREWQRLYLQFSYEIRKIALKYPDDVGNRKGSRKRLPKSPASRKRSASR